MYKFEIQILIQAVNNLLNRFLKIIKNALKIMSYTLIKKFTTRDIT